MKDTIRPFDTLIIKELDRLVRDMQGIKEEWDYFTERYVNIVVVDMPILNNYNTFLKTKSNW